jgi:hypothetical protein
VSEEPLNFLRGFLSTFFGWLVATIWFLCWAALVAWATLAIYYSNLPSAALRLGLAGAFAAFAVWALLLSRQRRMSVIVIALFLGVAAWWISISPSHDRPWRPEVAVMPRAFIDGDRVRLTGVRNFDYRTRDDFTVRYEERELQLSHLTALDFYVSYYARSGRTHLPEFHLRQRPAAKYLHRDAAGGRRKLCANSLPLQAIRVDLCGG